MIGNLPKNSGPRDALLLRRADRTCRTMTSSRAARRCPCLDEKGFRYYIPAFMVYGLRHWGDDWNEILNSCEYHLLNDYPKSLRKSEPAAIASKYQFTEAQSKAV